VGNVSNDYVTRVLEEPGSVDARAWNALLAEQAEPTPFMRHEYLAAMHESASAVSRTGWTPLFVTLWRGEELHAACAFYLKTHSYGEYVFDWAWANAYEEHKLEYYPKGLVASPFTPVPGTRLLARDASGRAALARELVDMTRQLKLSSLHILFATDEDAAACEAAGMMLRHNVQFHWTHEGWPTFDAFLSSLSHDKRKKIRQERRKVRDAGVSFRWSRGRDIRPADWDFFYSCYEQTYWEHGNSPYLTRDFFTRMAASMPDNWLLFIAERDSKPIASSLIALHGDRIAYGRYWGAKERVDCLHFEACYYQPLEWCMAHRFESFEGGAQGEHKMARALMPVKTTSAHWLAHPAFADAVEKFLQREGRGIDNYLEHLQERTPFRQSPTQHG
jgi:predicted N-acyltransferase